MNVSEIEKVCLTAGRLGFDLKDGRHISVPLSFYPTLQHATGAQRMNFEVYPFSVHWPDLDCDIGVEGLLAGARELPAYVARSKDQRDRSAAHAMTLAEDPPPYGGK